MSSQRPRISRQFGSIYIETPYNADFVEAIKFVVPRQHRSYEKGIWIVTPIYYSCIVALMDAFWGSKYINSVGAITEPQTSLWKEAWDVFRNSKDRQFRREHTEDNKTWGKVGKDAPTSAYNTLYVTANAPKQVIQAAYRALASMHHPDSGGDTETMARINAAYQTLKNSGKV